MLNTLTRPLTREPIRLEVWMRISVEYQIKEPTQPKALCNIHHIFLGTREYEEIN